MWPDFKRWNNGRFALLIFAIVFPLLFMFRIPYFVEGDTIFYASRAEKFVQGWDIFYPKMLTMPKHTLYLISLGVLRWTLPFLRTEDILTLFSTFFSSVAVALTYLLGIKIFDDRKLALISAGIFFSGRMFLYYTLLGEQYTFQAFFMLVTLLLLYDKRIVLAAVVLGVSLIASPSCGYFVFAYMYLIWKNSKSLLNELKIWAIPTAIFAPILFGLGDAYRNNVGWTLSAWWYHMNRGGFVTGMKIMATSMIDNFVVFLPFVLYGIFLAYKQHREFFWIFILAVLPASPLIIGGACMKWYLPMMPLFAICTTIPFKNDPKIKGFNIPIRKLFPALMIINLTIISSLMLIPLYRESINQREIFVSITQVKPIIMRWSSGMLYEYYGGDRAYYDILDIEENTTMLDEILDKYGHIYLYDYTEVQCQPTATLYGVFLKIVYHTEPFTVMDRILQKFDVNYIAYREFPDGTVIWELTKK